MMSSTYFPSFETLPIELIYHIFDHLDGQIIILSLRHVCKKLDNMIDTYFHQSGYKLNFDRITKSDFVRVCHFIKPKNVNSITLSNQCTTAGQISSFLLFFPTERFTQLRSLTLLHIKDKHLKRILQYAVTCPLIALDIQEKDASQRSNTTDVLLSTIIERPGLQNLTLSLTEDGTDQIKWPTSSTIRHLTLYSCHIKYFPIIFRHFSSLQTLSIKSSDLNDYSSFHLEDSLNLIPMRQLTSLKMEDIVINMNKIISILCNTPSLTYLRLIGTIDTIDFRWEKLIQEKLSLLTKFEFFLYTIILDNDYPTMTDVLIAPFRTPFWLEMKKWFVTCTQISYFTKNDMPLNHIIQLYSLPVCTNYRHYYTDSHTLTSSTSTELNNNVAVMDNIASSPIQFQRVLHLKIQFNCDWSDDFIQRLSSLFDLSHVEKLTLMNEFPQDLYPNTAISFIHLLEHVSNIHSLVIRAMWLDETCISNMVHFCSILPHHIKHLEIDVQFMDDMKIILERLENLSSVSFRYFNDEQDWQTDMMEWLSERRDFTYDMEYDTLHIWLSTKKKKNNNNNTSQQITTDNKRFKTDHY